MIRFLVILFFTVGLGAAPKPAATASHFDKEIQKNNRQLTSIKNELEKGREKLASLQKEEGKYLDLLEQLDKNIAASRSFLTLVSGKIDTAESLIVLLDDSLEGAQKKLSARQKLMSMRVRQAYLNKRQGVSFAIFNAQSPLEAVNNVKYLEKVGRYDRELLRQINTGKAEIEERRKQQVAELDHLSKLRDEKEKENRHLTSQETQRQKMLADIRKEKTSFEAMVRELERSQKELVAMIKLLEKKRKTAQQRTIKSGVAFDKRKGRLPWPIEGPIVTRFGKVTHPEYQTVIMNNGIDIGASKGEQVRCVAHGNVIHTGWMRGLGKMVIVEHSDGYLSIYAHLENIDVDVDEKLTPESIIGKVGATGSLGGSRMHFEIRKSSEALNPLDWLEKR